ncbi:MAG: hypothetical protein ABI789_02880 [Usitatibacter sp.]
MATLTTIFQLLLVWLSAYAMGLFAVKLLLPADLERSYGTLITPTVGYLTFCLFTFTLSATFTVPAATASWIVMGVLVFAGIATQFRAEWRLAPASVARDLRQTLVLVLPMAVATLSPLLYAGADTYVGSVNPDFFAGMVDNYYLLQGHSISTFAKTFKESSHPVETIAGHLLASARFGSGLFAIAMKLLLGVEMRTAMSLAIGFFVLSLPLTLYFMCRVVMLLDHRQARLAAWMIGISAPVAMSYLYYYLGQNSGLPALPLVLASGYLMLTRPGAKTLVFCALMGNALFVNYFAMLPYALAPAGPLALYLLATRRLTLKDAAALALGFTAISAALIVGNLATTLESMQLWLGIIGQSLQGQYFLDFLTEAFFPYFFGIYNYQFSPWMQWLLGPVTARVVGFAVSVACLALVAWSAWRWARDRADAPSRVFMVSAFLIYAAVWALYTFPKQYGYAVFKMSSWLQFMIVPFVAYAIDTLWRRAAPGGLRLGARFAATGGIAVGAAYVFLNFTASLQYAYNGLGRNTDTGYIVNHFGVSGNRDYFELAAGVAPFVKPEESIGMLFTDSIRNWWTSYYLKDFRQSFLSHVLIPGDDENLPDIDSEVVVDYYGNIERLRAEYFHGGASDQFFLTGSTTEINHDIIDQDFGAKPLWQNGTFRLFRASDLHDILITGRGFYRLEYFKPIKEYYFPRTMRWSAEGGEFFLLRPRHPGEPYRLAFDAIVGYEYENDNRTVELWLNGHKIQEAVIRHSARFVSEPFLPAPDVNKMVVRVKERNRPLPRRFVLWNRDIPTDYRRMNLGFSNARIITGESKPYAPAPALGTKIAFLQLHSVAERFNGLQLDGWLGEHAEVTLAAPSGATQLRMEGFAPGNLGFAFPFPVTVAVNGRAMEYKIAAPGPFTLDLPLRQGEGEAAVSILPSQSRNVGGEEIRHKVVKSSVRLDTLTFR